MTYRILCAYDSSPAADRAFDFSAMLAKRLEGELHVLSIHQPPEPFVESQAAGLLESARAQWNHVFEELRKRKPAAGVPLTFALKVGYPVHEILNCVKTLDVHHLVAGRRGGSGFERWAMGSVSQRLVMHAMTVVTVIA